MTSEVTKLSPEALAAWSAYDPPEMKWESTRIRFAFMSGWLAAKADRSAKRQDPQGLGPKGESSGRAAICPNDTGV